jgi:VanZ family protein
MGAMQTLLNWMAGPGSARARRALLVLLVFVVSCLALTPKPPEGSQSGLDKVAHLLAFTALAFSGCLGSPASRGTRTALLFGLLAFGGLIEVLQWFVPGRSSEWGDLLADGIGIAFGAGLASLVFRLKLRQRFASEAK